LQKQGKVTVASNFYSIYYLFAWCSGINMWRNCQNGLYFCSRNPTPEITSLVDVTWQPVEKNKTNYLDISKKLTMHKHYEHEHMALWDSVYSSTDETKSKL
jgi:hypothetical protein